MDDTSMTDICLMTDEELAQRIALGDYDAAMRIIVGSGDTSTSSS